MSRSLFPDFFGTMTAMLYSFFCLLLSATALWGVPKSDIIQTELAPFLKQETDQSSVEVSDRLPANLSGKALSGAARFEEVIEILRNVSVPIKDYLEHCDRIAWQELPFAQPLTLPQTPLNIHVGEGETNYLFGALRYYLAQRLVQARLFDEAKNVLKELTPENSIDPAGVLIAKAVVLHHFSEKEAGLAALEDFNAVAEREIVSRRSVELAKLLQFEWERQEQEEQTQSISRQMNDVRRRLGQGRTDEETQEAEEDVMQSLEELIEQVEEQAQRQREQRQSQQQANPRPDTPPDELPPPMDLKGPGNIDRRDLSLGDHWGDLPPKEREEALLRIEKEFPAYYREIIEQYFREMAK